MATEERLLREQRDAAAAERDALLTANDALTADNLRMGAERDALQAFVNRAVHLLEGHRALHTRDMDLDVRTGRWLDAVYIHNHKESDASPRDRDQ